MDGPPPKNEFRFWLLEHGEQRVGKPLKAASRQSVRHPPSPHICGDARRKAQVVPNGYFGGRRGDYPGRNERASTRLRWKRVLLRVAIIQHGDERRHIPARDSCNEPTGTPEGAAIDTRRGSGGKSCSKGKDFQLAGGTDHHKATN